MYDEEKKRWKKLSYHQPTNVQSMKYALDGWKWILNQEWMLDELQMRLWLTLINDGKWEKSPTYLELASISQVAFQQPKIDKKTLHSFLRKKIQFFFSFLWISFYMWPLTRKERQKKAHVLNQINWNVGKHDISYSTFGVCNVIVIRQKMRV